MELGLFVANHTGWLSTAILVSFAVLITWAAINYFTHQSDATGVMRGQGKLHAVVHDYLVTSCFFIIVISSLLFIGAKLS